MGKTRKVEDTETQDSGLLPIAKPLADDKLCEKVLKLVKKAAKDKKVRRGVKEVVKAIRKKQTGLCVIAGNVSPLDVVSHIPVLCEDAGIKYIFVQAKEPLGAACCTKRATSCVMLPLTLESDSKYESKMKECTSKVDEITPPVC